jgi:triacylglycerol esterase/lipase EstA (alpha/beta hydrolase family)
MHHIYLVPGVFGFTNLGRLRYFAHVREFLVAHCAALGLDAAVHVVKTFPTSSLPKRAARVVEAIAATPGSTGAAVHLIGHSSGGLDVRLMAASNVALPTDVHIERYAACVRSVVTVATPHYGTPVASFFATLLGQKLLRLLSLSTMYLLRFGHLPLSGLLQLGAVFARLDNLGINSVLLDELFGQLLKDFSVGRRRAVEILFRQVSKDQALLVQLMPEGMEVFNASIRNRPGVRYGSVITRSRRPGIVSTLATGLDPSAQATHAVYGALYRLAAHTPRGRSPRLTAEQARALRRAYGAQPSVTANDGMVPTRSQVWGDIIHAVQADHLDVIGHFGDPSQTPPHVDWLATGSGFNQEQFDALWLDVIQYIVKGAKHS